MQSLKEILQNLQNPQDDSDEKKDISQPELFDTKELKKEKNIFGEKGKYVSTEHQSYGIRLARKLDDMDRLPMYIKWAKEKNRTVLEIAYRFTIDYPSAKEKSRIFMWKVKELEKEFSKKD